MNTTSATAKKVNSKVIIVIVAIVAVLAVLHVLTGFKLLSGTNLLNLLSSMTVPTILATGFAFVFGSNVTDLSPGAMVILAATVAGVSGNALGIPMMIVLSIAVGIGMGALNFSIFRIAKIPPWIAGLGMTMVYEAIVGWYSSYRVSQGLTTVMLNDNARVIGMTPYIYIVLAITIVAGYIIYNHTTAGINLRAAGCNEQVAGIMGINVTKSLIICGIIAGAFFGFAGCVKEAYAGFANAQSGLSSLSTTFQPLAAVLLAKAISKYVNYMIGIPIGTFIIVLTFNCLTLLGVPSGTFQDACLGLVVIVFGLLAQRGVKGVVK